MRARSWVVDPLDEAELEWLRGRLAQARRELGRPAKHAAVEAGLHPDFFSHMERLKVFSPCLSTVQKWSRGLGLRLEVEFDGFWRFAWPSGSEMLALWALSRPFGADVWLRAWAADALGALRERRGLDVGVVAAALGTSRATFLDRENRAEDPYVRRLFALSRVLGAPMRFRLFREDEWVWG